MCVDMDGVIAGMLLPRSVYVANVNVVYGGMCGGSRFNAPNDQTFLSSLPTSPTYHITLHHQPSLHSYYQRSLAIIVNNVCKGILNTECLFVYSCYKKLKPTHMYTLDCSYYTRSFDSIDELIDDVTVSGMDPNYEITCDGKPTGEMMIDLIGF